MTELNIHTQTDGYANTVLVFEIFVDMFAL